jgi:hypothetical protein
MCGGVRKREFGLNLRRIAGGLFEPQLWLECGCSYWLGRSLSGHSFLRPVSDAKSAKFRMGHPELLGP